MGAMQDILSTLNLGQIASILGSDENEVQQAASTAVGSLLDGVENNISDPQGAMSLANALGQHVGSGALGASLGQLDLGDGAKIVNHILPAQQQQALFGGAQGGLIQKLLPLVAPLVMSYLAKQLSGKLTQGGGLESGLGSVLGSVLGGGGASGGLGSILGSVLGGGQGQSPAQSGGLGDVLGSILGGGQTKQQTQEQGGLGDLLGQVLGGAQSGGLSLPDPGQSSAHSAGAGDLVGGLLKNILFGK